MFFLKIIPPHSLIIPPRDSPPSLAHQEQLPRVPSPFLNQLFASLHPVTLQSPRRREAYLGEVPITLPTFKFLIIEETQLFEASVDP